MFVPFALSAIRRFPLHAIPRIPQKTRTKRMATCAYDPQKTAETWDRIHEASETGALRQSSQTSQLSQSGSQMAPSNWTLFHILRRHFEQNNTPLSPRIVVDLGSGTGDTLLSLANEVGDNVHLLGSDISAEAVRQANTKARMMGIGAKVNFLHAAVENFPWGNVPNLAGCPRGTIAAVNVDHVLQYLSPDIRHDMMVSIGKHMALGGILSMRTITPSGPFFENIKIQKEAHPTLPNAFLNHGAFIQFLSPPQLNALFTDDYTPLCDFSTLLTPYQYGVGLRLQSYMRIAQYAPGETRLDPGISRPPFLRYFASTLPPNRYTTANPMRLLGVGYPSEYSVMQEIKRILAHYYGERFSMAESASPVPDFPDNTFDAIYLTADPHMPNWQGQKGFREKLLSGRCQDALLRLVKPGGVISANVTKPAHLDTVTPSLDTIRASFFCSPEQNPCLVVTEGNVFRGPKKSQHDIVWRLATRVDRKPTGGVYGQQQRGYHHSVGDQDYPYKIPLPEVKGLTMSRTPILDPSVLTDFVSRTAHTFARATQMTNAESETYHHHTGQHSNTVTLSDKKNPPVSAQLFRDYGDHGLSAKGHDLLYFQRDVMPNYLSHMYRHVLAQEVVQMALRRAELPVDASSLSTRLTVNAYRLLDPKTGLHAGFPPHVDLSSNGKLTLILSGTEERMSFFRLRRPTEGPLSREAIALGENRQELTLPAGTLTVIHGEALTQWAHEVLPMVRDPKYDYFSWVFGVRKK